MKTIKTIVLFVLLSNHAHGSSELVMHEGVTIEAHADNSSVKIISSKGFDRIYEWDDCKLKSNMRARRQRWYGSMGIYDPAPSFGFSFGGCSGISRTVVQEGQIHFDDSQFAYKWIQRRPKSDKTVWTNDGLLVSWNIVPERMQLNVDVWLICIDGKRPRQLDGATDSAVNVSINQAGQSIHECVLVGKDIIDQTRVQLEAEWKKTDEWIEKDKEYRERRQGQIK